MRTPRQIAIRSQRPRPAFTLVEVLIVVVIVAVLSAVVIGQYTDSSDDARQSVLKHNHHVLQCQIGMYAVNGFAHRYGPYLDVVPTNPFSDNNQVVAVTQSGQRPTAPVGTDGGWQYDLTTGDVWPNHPEYYE